MGCQGYHFSCCLRHCLTCVSCVLSFFLAFFSLFAFVHRHRAMGKEKSTQSRVLRRLEPYNKSPSGRTRDRGSGDVRSSHDSPIGSTSRRRSHGSCSRSRSPAQPPEWAKQLLEQQRANAAELKRLQSEFASATGPKVAAKQRAPEPEFCFAGNKKQYELNRDVVETLDEVLQANNAEERTSKLNEGRDLLLERNKHILLAKKYGWDAMACYTAEPLATDSDDEKRIRKAVKESKQLREEKKRSSGIKQKVKGGVPRQSSERRVFLD